MDPAAGDEHKQVKFLSGAGVGHRGHKQALVCVCQRSYTRRKWILSSISPNPGLPWQGTAQDSPWHKLQCLRVKLGNHPNTPQQFHPNLSHAHEPLWEAITELEKGFYEQTGQGGCVCTELTFPNSLALGFCWVLQGNQNTLSDPNQTLE